MCVCHYKPLKSSLSPTPVHSQIEKAYRKLLEKFSDDRWNHNKCEGEYGLYYEQKRKKHPPEPEEEESKEMEFDIEVRGTAVYSSYY